VGVPLSLDEIKDNYERYRQLYSDRDTRMEQVLLVRKGRMRDVFPDLFPDGPFENPIVANMVDISARDLSEVIAPLPAFNCNSPSMVSDKERKKADKREEIVNGIIDFSDLQTQMFPAADRYVSYGFVPAQVEVDLENNMPRIRFFDSYGCYPIIDRFGKVHGMYQRIKKPLAELMSAYPEYAHLLYDKDSTDSMLEIVRYHDKDQDILFVPSRNNIVIDRTPNPIGECLVRVVKRPSLDGETRGQFDDVLAIQVAKARYALLSLEQALMGGFDTQIKTAHAMFARAFVELIGLALKVDEKVFGDMEKTLRGTRNGVPYAIKYKPARDIDGDYTVDVQYGLMAGLDPNRALVFGLQARGDKLISRDFLRRQMPFSFNATQEEEKVDTEDLRDAMKQAIASYAQAIPALASQGQNPSDILYKLSTVINERQKGTPIEQAVSEAFQPENPPPGAMTPEAVSPDMLGLPGAVPPGEGQLPEGLSATGRMIGVAPGQIAPGGRPDVQSLLASLTQRGEPNLQASLVRRLPV